MRNWAICLSLLCSCGGRGAEIDPERDGGAARGQDGARTDSGVEGGGADPDGGASPAGGDAGPMCQGGGVLAWSQPPGRTQQELGPTFELVAAADMDGDGDRDLLMIVRPDSLSILTNDGRGGFSRGPSARVGPAPTSVELADFDGDGDPDVLARTVAPPLRAAQLVPNEGGRLGEPQDVTVDLPSNDLSPQASIAVGDFDGDKRADLVFTFIAPAPTMPRSVPGTGALLVNEGNGRFRVAQLIEAALPRTRPDAVDWDGDGRLDVVADWSGGQLPWLHNEGGRFSVRQLTVDMMVVGPSSPRVIADVDRDGDPDIVQGGFLLRNDGAARLTAIELYPGARGSASHPMAATDLDHDGDVDLVAGPGLRVVRNQGGSRFSLEAYAWSGTTRPIVADFDGDGRADILGMAFNVLSLQRTDATGRFPLPTYATAGGPEDILAVDVDGDRALDLLTANSGSSASLLRGDGRGGFSPAVHVGLSEMHSNFVEGVAAGDFDGDGRQDLALARQSLGVSIHNGVGAAFAFVFKQLVPLIDASMSPDWLEDIATGDLDGDGDLDLVTANGAGRRDLNLLWNDGRGTFEAGARLPSGDTPGTVVLADLDRDKRLDVIAANEGPAVGQNDRGLMVLRGLGGGRFAGVRYLGSVAAEGIVATDLDGDGAPDLATLGKGVTGASKLYLLWNDGNGAFGTPTELPAGVLPRALTSGDVDGDGRIDLAAADEHGHVVLTLIGAGGRTFRPGPSLPAGAGPEGIVAADFDGRCGIDLAISNSGGDDVLVLRAGALPAR